MKAGLVYFGLVFALGFVLGVARTLLLPGLPGQSRLLGVLIELPIVLAASWALCGVVVRRLHVEAALRARATMGAVALALLLGAELWVSVALAGRTLQQHFSLYRDASYALGLAAQLAFAAMPVMRLRIEQRAARRAA
jgi:hypothetical protein